MTTAIRSLATGTEEDAVSFKIDSKTGQISVKDNEALNFETDAAEAVSFDVEVTATDPSGASGLHHSDYHSHCS